MKRTLKLLLPVGVRRERMALRSLPLGLHLEHAGGILVNALRGFFLRFFPSCPAELGKLGIFAAEPHIARDLPGLIQRHIQAGAVGKFQHQHFAFAVGRFFESLVATDSMVEMHHEVARLEFRKIHNCPPRPNPFTPQRRPVRTLACRAPEHLGLRKQRQLRLRAHESPCRPRGEEDQIRSVEIEISRHLSETLAFTFVHACEGNRPAVSCPTVELIKKTVALGFIQHQIASSEVTERRWIEHRCGLRSLTATSDAEALEFAIRLDDDDAILRPKIIAKRAPGGFRASGVNFRFSHLADRSLRIEVEFAEGIDFQIKPLEPHRALLLP